MFLYMKAGLVCTEIELIIITIQRKNLFHNRPNIDMFNPYPANTESD